MRWWLLIWNIVLFDCLNSEFHDGLSVPTKQFGGSKWARPDYLGFVLGGCHDFGDLLESAVV